MLKCLYSNKNIEKYNIMHFLEIFDPIFNSNES